MILMIAMKILNKIDFKLNIIRFLKMDYFGLLPECHSELSPVTQNVESFPKNNCGFGCATLNCKNKEATYGTFILPHCDTNIICMKANIEYLSLENARLKGEIGGMEFILSKLSDFTTQPKTNSMDTSS